jgi:hypothetical protein
MLGASLVGCKPYDQSLTEIASRVCRQPIDIGAKTSVAGIVTLSAEGSKLYPGVEKELDIFTANPDPIFLVFANPDHDDAIDAFTVALKADQNVFRSKVVVYGRYVRSPNKCGPRQEYNMAFIVESSRFVN